MKKLIAKLQGKEESREEMIKKLEEIILPLAEVLNDRVPVYCGFLVETIALKGSDDAFIISFNNSTLALVDLKKSNFSVFGSAKYELTAEEHAVISHLWAELQKKRSNNVMENLIKMFASEFGDN